MKVGNSQVYRIYHVIGVKIGCTKNSVEYRCRQQGLEHLPREVLDIIPEELGDQFAGDSERFWQEYYGYVDDKHHYTKRWDTNMTPEQRFKGSSKGGIEAGRRGSTGFQTGIAGKQGYIAQRDAGKNKFHTGEAGRRASELRVTAFQNGAAPAAGRVGGKISSQIERTCPGCGETKRGNKWKHHIDNLLCQVTKVI